MTDHKDCSADIVDALAKTIWLAEFKRAFDRDPSDPWENQAESSKANHLNTARKIIDAGFVTGAPAQPALLSQIEAEARRYADMYPQSSDGRNTFVIFADWVARLFAQPPADPAANEPTAWIVLSEETGNTRIWWRDKERAEEWSRQHNKPLIPLYADPRLGDVLPLQHSSAATGDELTADSYIMIWSMRPQPGTDAGDAWEAGARQGWRWAEQEAARRAALTTTEPQAAPEKQRYVAELSLNGRYVWCIVEAIPRVENVIEQFGCGPDAQKAAQNKLNASSPLSGPAGGSK